jgi:hypothetical protein
MASTRGLINIRITGNTTGAQSTNGGLLQSCGNNQVNRNKTDGTCRPSRSTEDPRADLAASGPKCN